MVRVIKIRKDAFYFVLIKWLFHTNRYSYNFPFIYCSKIYKNKNKIPTHKKEQQRNMKSVCKSCSFNKTFLEYLINCKLEM